MAIETIKVPDIGGAENVDVIEVNVSVGDIIAAEDPLIIVESDKASMDIPSPKAGKVTKLLLKEGDQVSEGSDIVEVDTDAEAGAENASAEQAPASEEKSAPARADSGKATPSQGSDSAGGERAVAVPDIGGAENVDVIEVCVAVGDEVQEGDSLIVLESDKSSMEVPSPASGKVLSLAVKEGDKVSEGDAILALSSAGEGEGASPSSGTEEPAPSTETDSSSSSSTLALDVPDIGGSENVDVIEVCISEGDEIQEGDSLIVLESDKSSMEVPSPASGKVLKVTVKEGDKVSMGSAIGQLLVAGSPSKPASADKPPASAQQATKAPAQQSETTKAPAASTVSTGASATEGSSPGGGADVYAGPAVRKLARQLGVELKDVKASGPRGRVVKDDVRNYVKNIMQDRGKSSGVVAGGAGIPPIPEVDFSRFGSVEKVKMSKIKKLTAANMSRNWLNIPHVTQFDDVDITDMENFRKAMKADAEKAGVKLTPLPFLIKACAAALRAEPSFNVSLHVDGEHLVHKHYVHIGLAVDTPNGLMVPVIQNADQKGLFELAKEATELAKKARDGKLKPNEMQGGCFTISSLGAVGGTGFTPIVNGPEVGILGVSRAEIKPTWNGTEFVPRLKLPLCLSYDHRAINGGDAGRFMTYLGGVLTEVRRLLL